MKSFRLLHGLNNGYKYERYNKVAPTHLFGLIYSTGCHGYPVTFSNLDGGAYMTSKGSTCYVVMGALHKLKNEMPFPYTFYLLELTTIPCWFFSKCFDYTHMNLIKGSRSENFPFSITVKGSIKFLFRLGWLVVF